MADEADNTPVSREDYDKLNRKYDRLTHRLERLTTKTYRILLGIVVGLFVSGLGFTYVIKENGQRAEDNRDTVGQIQKERVSNIIRGCEATNVRHDNAIAALDSVMKQLPPERQAQARDSRNFTVLLINAIVPRRDCLAEVKEQVRSVFRED